MRSEPVAMAALKVRGKRTWPAVAVGTALVCAAWGAVAVGWVRIPSNVDEDRVWPKAPVDRAISAQPMAQRDTQEAAGQSAGTPAGGPEAHIHGYFGAPFTWQIIPIHVVLLPDGRVLSYGSKTDGLQGGLLNYSVWDPSKGRGLTAMTLLPNTYGTDIFCAGQALMPSGDVLLIGGDRKVGDQRNYANADVNIFSPTANTLTKQAQSMAYQRWYATIVTTAQNEQVVMGGRIDKEFEGNASAPPSVATYASTPEVYTAAAGWRTLSTAPSETAYGGNLNAWWYPRAWLAPNGLIFVMAHGGKMFYLDPAGTGTLTQLPVNAPAANDTLPSVMFAPGKILSVRGNAQAVVVDINQPTPTVTPTGALSWNRQYGSATVLADGKVFVNGGSSTGNDLVGAAYHSETWDPATGVWTTHVSAQKPRLYHSIGMLLPDGSVLTGGGGAPGPVTNMNAEIYYPPYLYKTDGSGSVAPRPKVVTPAPSALGWGQKFTVEMKGKGAISRVTLIRSGTVTHAFNSETRFQEMAFTQKGAKLKLTMPTDRNLAPPGYYHLFVFDAQGVPAIAQSIRLMD